MKDKKLIDSISLTERMDKHMSLSESLDYINDLNKDLDLPHSDDIFDLDKIPMDVLDKAWKRYHPYLLGIDHRHPFSNNLVVEGTDYKEQLENIREIITNTFPIPIENFIIKEGNNDMFAAILISLLDDNEDVIEQAMEKKGFFRSQPTDEKLLMDKKNRKWLDIRFEPKLPDDVTEEVHRKFKYLYHLSPKIFELPIETNGFIASNKNSDYRYSENRAYFMKGDTTAKDIQELVNVLYTQAQNKNIANLTPYYVLFTIDLQKLNKEYRFYYDINEPQGLYTLKDVPPNVIINKKEIKAQTTDKL